MHKCTLLLCFWVFLHVYALTSVFSYALSLSDIHLLSNGQHWGADTEVGLLKSMLAISDTFSHTHTHVTVNTNITMLHLHWFIWAYWWILPLLPLQCQQHHVSLSSGWLPVPVWALPKEELDSLTLWALSSASVDTSQSALVGWEPLLWKWLQPVSPHCTALPPSSAEAGQPTWVGSVFVIGSFFHPQMGQKH